MNHLVVFHEPLRFFGSTMDSFSTERAADMKVAWDVQPEALYLTAKREIPGVGGPALQTQKVRIPWTSIAFYSSTEVEQPRAAASAPNAPPNKR